MANLLHLENALSWWLTDDIRIVLVDAGFPFVPSPTEQFLSDIPVGARVAMSSADLTTKTITGDYGPAVVDADNYTFIGLAGASIEYVYLVRYTGVDATSKIVMRFDTATGLPLTPSGVNMIATWNPSGVFGLT